MEYSQFHIQSAKHCLARHLLVDLLCYIVACHFGVYMGAYMKLRIKLIPLALAKQGMELGAPVHDTHGHALLMAGAELSKSVLSGLQRHNICCVSVLEEDTRSEEELAIERNQTTERIDALFRNMDQTASLESLHRLVLEYRLEPLL